MIAHMTDDGALSARTVLFRPSQLRIESLVVVNDRHRGFRLIKAPPLVLAPRELNNRENNGEVVLGILAYGGEQLSLEPQLILDIIVSVVIVTDIN
jgi:hypothetical protein